MALVVSEGGRGGGLLELDRVLDGVKEGASRHFPFGRDERRLASSIGCARGSAETRRAADWGPVVGDRSSGDPPAGAAGGRVEGHNQTTAGGVADEQTLADRDQTLSDADQTSADADQSSADRDQLAADHDQAASDRDLLSGADPDAHEHSRDVRAGTAREREQTARERDETARARLSAADQRDAIADSRDLSAQHRDEAADARTAAMAELEATMELQEDAREPRGAGAIIRAAGQRRRAAERRAQAAEYRELAADDRRAAARDREQAAQERSNALSDREALAAQIEHQRARYRQAVRHQHRVQELAETLQRGLTPPRLPRITGLDVAVHHEPFAQAEVGGDFYDLFALADDWAGFFFGDVCGKGPRAAADTALARYTMRTAAMLQETPAAVLADLNAALRAATDPPTTCTAVYGQIDMSGATATITLAVGGHPPPLVIRADGSVETTPARGPLLGAIDDPVFHTCELRFDVGDALFVYSDGILDSAIDGVPVDEQRISEVLANVPHASATDLVGALLGSMRRIDRALRDDVAFIALRYVDVHGSAS